MAASFATTGSGHPCDIVSKPASPSNWPSSNTSARAVIAPAGQWASSRRAALEWRKPRSNAASRARLIGSGGTDHHSQVCHLVADRRIAVSHCDHVGVEIVEL